MGSYVSLAGNRTRTKARGAHNWMPLSVVEVADSVMHLVVNQSYASSNLVLHPRLYLGA